MKILILDNFDSFTYNLYQLVGELLSDANKPFVLEVLRNNEIGLEEIQKRGYERIIISPGPGNPADIQYFGICKDVILKATAKTPILGVCLGLQGIAHYFGGKVVRAKQPMHGKTSKLKHNQKSLFKGVPQGIEVMRYHSLVVEAKSLPKVLSITAFASAKENREIMALEHKILPIFGVQFHPESFATEFGKKIISNFLFQDYENLAN